jgi:hypothetical protein
MFCGGAGSRKILWTGRGGIDKTSGRKVFRMNSVRIIELVVRDT